MGYPPGPMGPHAATFIYSMNVTVPGSGNFVLPTAANGFYVGGAGHVTIINEDGTTATFSSFPAGQWKRVRFVGFVGDTTTATAIVVLF